MYFSGNIKLLRKRRHRTQEDVAVALRTKRSTLSGYENEVAQPNIQALVAFSDYFRISIDTLIKVNLGVLSESQLSELERGYDVFIRGTQLRVLTTTVDRDNNENIELVPIKAKAGYSRGFSDPEFIQELPRYQLPFLSKEKKYRTFQITGDSMLPIPDGAWVTGEFVLDWNDLKDNELYIIVTLDDGLVFKVMENKLTENRSFKLHSLNPSYVPYEVPANEVSEIWKFTNYISSEIPQPEIPKGDLISEIARLRKDMDKINEKLDKKL